MKRVIVIGAGTMGSGIAHTMALADHQVYLFDKSVTALEKAKITICNNLERQLKKDTISSVQCQNAKSNIKYLVDIQLLPIDSELIIEAIIENKEAKSSLYNELSSHISENTILATNTSSISITALAPKSISERFIGMHFMNPVPIMQLVEIIPGYSTSDDTTRKVVEFVDSLGKKPILVKDYPGFIANRILMPMINEAIFALYEGVAKVEDIDSIMKLGMNHPMGPLMLADFIGLDVCLNIMEVLYEGFSDPKYRPCPLLKNMVNAGKLGRKTKSGFYEYYT
jgi:3-hydroxybutyryl-CoA dehydrogenase